MSVCCITSHLHVLEAVLAIARQIFFMNLVQNKSFHFENAWLQTLCHIYESFCALLCFVAPDLNKCTYLLLAINNTIAQKVTLLGCARVNYITPRKLILRTKMKAYIGQKCALSKEIISMLHWIYWVAMKMLFVQYIQMYSSIWQTILFVR